MTANHSTVLYRNMKAVPPMIVRGEGVYLFDAQGRRYCYGKQPQIAQWNLVRLANALYPLFNDKAPLEQGLAAIP